MSSEELTNTLLELVERSEARIDKTNTMVQVLSDTCRRNMEMYEEHLKSLEASRDVAQKNASEAIELSREMTNFLTLLRKDFQERNNAITKELHILRDEYKKDLDEMRKDYRKMADSYTHLAESRHAGNRSEIKIGK